jgi:hypothetical protein
MFRRFVQGTLALVFAVALATPPARAAGPPGIEAGLFDALWGWVVSLLGEEAPTPPPVPDPQGPAPDDDQGYSIDPDG